MTPTAEDSLDGHPPVDTLADAGRRERREEFLRDVLEGLGAASKRLSSKYFYDRRGSELFDRITRLPEYYLTRTERAIMRAHVAEMAAEIGSRVMLVEFGSGSSSKTRILLDHLEEPVAYVPVDISAEHLLKTAEELRAAYREIEILPLVVDFTQPFKLPASRRPRSHAAFYFPGSTIGNFGFDEASRTLKRIADALGPRGGLLIGIDLVKDPEVIEAAYNDSAGVTDEFNLNVLRRINRELGGDFAIDHFRHKAVYDRALHRIESSLVSLREQSVTIAGESFEFTAGEEIVTEYSHKYTIEGFADLARGAGFALRRSWTDRDGYFAVLYLVGE